MIKIAIYGKSGVGKSTIAKIIMDYYTKMGKTIKVIKLAEPLYKIQRMIYEECGISIPYYKQDQKLLAEIADIMRK